MAKRKLSLKQRIAVRSEISVGLARQRKPADILREVAAKYGITTITGRWYLKQVRDASQQSHASKDHRLPDRRGRSSTGSIAKRSPTHPSLRDVLEAKKLIPQWQMFVKKEESLRKLEGKIWHELQEVTTKASKLQQRIRALTAL